MGFGVFQDSTITNDPCLQVTFEGGLVRDGDRNTRVWNESSFSVGKIDFVGTFFLGIKFFVGFDDVISQRRIANFSEKGSKPLTDRDSFVNWVIDIYDSIKGGFERLTVRA